jgi:dihydroxyacetone kinase-like protein
MTTLASTHLRAWLTEAAARLRDAADHLTALDAAIGDGDHGHNMARGFGAVAERLAGLADDEAGALLKLAGSTLVSTVGGAAGPLYGTAFLRAAAALAGKRSLTAADLAAGWRAALDGVVARGKATAGEKTMIDALLPAVEVLEEAAALGRRRRARRAGDDPAGGDQRAGLVPGRAQRRPPRSRRHLGRAAAARPGRYRRRARRGVTGDRPSEHCLPPRLKSRCSDAATPRLDRWHNQV